MLHARDIVYRLSSNSSRYVTTAHENFIRKLRENPGHEFTAFSTSRRRCKIALKGLFPRKTNDALLFYFKMQFTIAGAFGALNETRRLFAGPCLFGDRSRLLSVFLSFQVKALYLPRWIKKSIFRFLHIWKASCPENFVLISQKLRKLCNFERQGITRLETILKTLNAFFSEHDFQTRWTLYLENHSTDSLQICMKYSLKHYAVPDDLTFLNFISNSLIIKRTERFFRRNSILQLYMVAILLWNAKLNFCDRQELINSIYF